MKSVSIYSGTYSKIIVEICKNQKMAEKNLPKYSISKGAMLFQKQMSVI